MTVHKFIFKAVRYCGLFLLGAYLTLVFIISGLFLNLLQLVLYKTIFPINRSLYRKLNYYLIYASWAQILSVYEWRSNSSCNMYGTEESLRKFGTEHCIVVMNHKYDIDWLICWFVTNHLRVLANSKTCAKKQLRNVPVIGWGWIFAEMIFLERNWEKDKLTFGDKLDKLIEYEDPIMLLYFCEGTRFTTEKHKASVEFAKSRDLPLLQHHLTPRTSGFNFAARHLKDKISAIYNVQLGFPNTPKKPTFSNLLRGYSFTADLYVDRIPMSDVPTESDEATSKFQHDLYQKKDTLTDDYIKTGKFPGRCVNIKRSYRVLINTLFWSIAVIMPFWYLVSFIASSSTPVAFSIMLGLLGIMYYMVSTTKADKGSSYGKDKKSPVKIKNGTNHANGECDNLGSPTITVDPVLEEPNATVSEQSHNS